MDIGAVIDSVLQVFPEAELTHADGGWYNIALGAYLFSIDISIGAVQARITIDFYELAPGSDIPLYNHDYTLHTYSLPHEIDVTRRIVESINLYVCETVIDA